jgi:hypothetical protein
MTAEMSKLHDVAGRCRRCGSASVLPSFSGHCANGAPRA